MDFIRTNIEILHRHNVFQTLHANNLCGSFRESFGYDAWEHLYGGIYFAIS